MVEKQRKILPVKFIDRYGPNGIYHNYNLTHHLPKEYEETVIGPFTKFLSKSYKHARVLDVASGIGEVAKYLSRLKKLQVVQTDISQFALSRSNGQRVRALAQELPFEDSSFDVIHMKDALVHFNDQRGLLTEFQRIMKPSGYLLLTSFTFSKKCFGLILKSSPIVSTSLPYMDKSQFILWSSFFEKLKIFDVSPPYFPVSENAVVKLANKIGFNQVAKTNWTTNWRNPDWTLFPAKRFSILFKKVS